MTMVIFIKTVSTREEVSSPLSLEETRIRYTLQAIDIYVTYHNNTRSQLIISYKIL